MPLLFINFMGHYESRGPYLLCPQNTHILLKNFLKNTQISLSIYDRKVIVQSRILKRSTIPKVNESKGAFNLLCC